MHSGHLLLGFGLVAQLTSAQQATHTPRPGSLFLFRRDGPPTASCPEQFGNAPMNCDDPACGGQSNTAGVCKSNSSSGKPCQCKVATASAPAPTNTQVTTTDSAGSTVIGSYDLITVDQYKSLKQSQTVTLTQTTTGSDGKQTVATAAAVVAAGGVVWILGTGADAAGILLLAQKPPPPPEANKDDPSCPAQEHKCKDCAAVPGINMCISPDGGCGCDPEEKECPTTPARCDDSACAGENGKCTKGDPSNCSCQSCPTGDQQPQCDDETKCEGKDGICTIGDNKGCGCKQNACPEERYTPYCDFCGDKGSDGKCKGIADKNNLWKGCTCWDEPPDPTPWPQLDQSILDFDQDSLPDVSPSSYSYDGNDPLKCQNLGWSAKKDDLKNSVTSWCKSVDGKQVTKTGDTDVLYKRFSYDYYSYWLAAQYDGESGGNCGDSADINEINCVSTMLEELDDCNSGQSTFNGAELTDGCVKYQITFSRSTNDNDPPFKPLPRKSADCAKDQGDVTEVAFNFWQGVSKKFCKDVGDGKTAMKEDLKNTDLQTRSIFRRTPPPSTGSYPDWKFHFEWAPTGDGACSETCDEAMSQIADTCGHMGMQQNSMVKKGTLDVGCGTYTFELDGPPPTNSSPSPDGTNKKCVPEGLYPRGFDRDEAMNTIVPQFCGQDNVKNQMFGKDSKYPTLDYRSQVYPDMMVNLAITRGQCDDATSTFVTQDRCTHLMGAIDVDACSSTVTDKMGGTVDDGCVTYSIKSSKYNGDYAHGTCSISITQYYDGKDYTIDGYVKDAKGGLLTQCKGQKAALNTVVLCQTGNHSMLPKLVHITQRQNAQATMDIMYGDTTFSTIDKNCKGGNANTLGMFVGGRTITCTLSC